MGWASTTIGEVASYINGRAFKPAEWESFGKPIIRIQNLNNSDAFYNYSNAEYEKKYLVKHGDLLFAWSASLGAHIWKGNDAWLNQHIFNVIPEKGVDKFYLYYLLSKITAELYAKAHGSGMVHVTKGKFESTKINLPPCKEQKRIVAKIEELFSELDNGIAALKTAREQLKVYRQAVLKHAFEGKLTAQWRKESGVSQSTWREMTVKELAVLGPSNGKSVKDLAGGFPVLRLTALKKGKVDLDEFKEGAWSAKEASSYLVQNGDFLFSRGNGSKHLVGRGGLVREPKSKVAFPDTIMRIRLDTEKVKPEYFSYAWESRLIRKQIEQSARTTAGIYKINQQHVKGFTLPIPPVSEQKIISSLLEEKISSIDALLYDTEQQLLKTETLRQSILKKAFSGQLVPQDPNDEPASELLARIKAEKVAQKAAEKAQQAAGKKPTAKRGRKLREPVQ
jgi:type I restriction enzyme S subunit